MPPRDPFGANTALASQRKVQASRDTQKQRKDLEEFQITHDYMYTPEWKKKVETSRRRMEEINNEKEAIYNANREKSIAFLAGLDEEDRRKSSIFGKVSRIFNGTNKTERKGGSSQSKEILGKQRRIYKVAGSRKEHIKYKGQLIPVSDYKKLMKPKH
jgi:hypothetical protein